MPPRIPSVVWKYFTRSEDKTTATCSLCNEKFSYQSGGTTSNLNNHLRNKHPSLELTDKAKQVSMSTFVTTPKKKLSNSESERITQAIANMIVKDYLPLSIVEGEGFRELFGIIAPDYTVPSRNTVRARVEKQYDDKKGVFLSTLDSVSSVSITTDTWTSTANESYLTVTEHHIDDNWALQSNVLITRAMPERHTGENLAARLKDCVSEFGLDGKVAMCVHDNARNIESAGHMCEDWGDLGCFAHTLQLCVRPVFELPSVSRVVSNCRRLVGHFRHSTTLTAELRKRQVLLEEPKHELIQDVPTCWNSTQMMLQRLTEQRRVITDLMLDTHITKKGDAHLLPKDHEWELISELSSVLSDITDVTAYMSTESSVSCSQVYPIVCGLIQRSLRYDSEDSGCVSRVKQVIRTELDRRYKPTTTETATSVPVLASLLDPRYKRLQFLPRDLRRATEEELENRMDEIPLRLPGRSASECEPTPSKWQKLDFMVFGSPDREENDELKSYLGEKSDANCNPLTWWSRNSEKYPKLAIIARKFLSVPASSVPSERVFSAAGLLVNKLRNRLSSDIVDQIIFLNKNKVQCNSE